MVSALAQQIEARRSMMAAAGRRRPFRKRVSKQLQPNAIRLAYFSALQEMMEYAQRLVARRVLPLLPSLARRVDTARLDADINDILDEIEEDFFDEWPNARMGALAKQFARRTSDFQREQLAKQIKETMGVDLGALLEPRLVSRLESFTKENVALIKSLPSRYFSDIERQVAHAVREGTRHEDLAKDLAERYTVSASRAKLIARDQVGKLYGEVNRVRQEALGLDSYIWRTDRDNRVREEHREREGVKYSWDEPPWDGAPGEPINCRCHAEPDFDQLFRELGV